MRTTIYISNWRLDLFKDEGVDLVSSVLDISDITKNTGDYTKTFTVPASKRNNILFKHWYDANIDNSFDARTKVDGEIFLDGLPFKTGKFRLSKVSVKKGKPTSYTINFFGNLVSLKDTLGKDELTDLDFSAYDHDHTSDNVLTGLQGSLSSGDIIYNLFPKKQYYYNDNASDNVQTENLANIAYGGGADTGVLWGDLRPSIRLIKIIEAIEYEYTSANGYENPIVFSRDFLGTSEFTDLFMWLNPDKDTVLGGETKIIDWTTGDTNWINLSTNIGSFEIISIPGNESASRYFEFKCVVTPQPWSITVPYEIVVLRDGEEFFVTQHVGESTQEFDLLPEGDTNGTTYAISWYIRTSQDFSYVAIVYQEQFSPQLPNTPLLSKATAANPNSNDSVVEIINNVPKLKILDFLKGIFNMFKLIVIPQDDGTLYVDTLKSYYSLGNTYDITKYINFNEFNVERGLILNEIEMKYQEPSTILNIQFEKNNRRGYGDEVFTLKDSNDKLLDGESLSFTLPFEQIVYERLTDQSSGDTINIQYGAIIDENLEPVNPKPHIFYNVLYPTAAATVGFINDSAVKVPITGSINLPFHSNTPYGTPNYSTTFKNEFSTWNGQAMNNNLYSRHYSEYIDNIFNIKKRTFIYESILPIHIITKLELNDTLVIKENYYRIDKYSYNLFTGKTKLTLINNFDASINPIESLTKSITVSFISQEETIAVTNSTSVVPTKIDNGHGTGWVTVSKSNENNTVTFTENTSYSKRTMYLQYLNASGDTIYIYLTQEPEFTSPLLDFSDNRNSQYLITIL